MLCDDKKMINIRRKTLVPSRHTLGDAVVSGVAGSTKSHMTVC